jgi:hypothetical protein
MFLSWFRGFWFQFQGRSICRSQVYTKLYVPPVDHHCHYITGQDGTCPVCILCTSMCMEALNKQCCCIAERVSFLFQRRRASIAVFRPLGSPDSTRILNTSLSFGVSSKPEGFTINKYSTLTNWAQDVLCYFMHCTCTHISVRHNLTCLFSLTCSINLGADIAVSSTHIAFL